MPEEGLQTFLKIGPWEFEKAFLAGIMPLSNYKEIRFFIYALDRVILPL